MSRSDYTEDGDTWSQIRWRGAVKSAIQGQRGQSLLKEMLVALDEMPEKKLIAHEFMDSDGSFCLLGVIAKNRCIDVSNLDPEDYGVVSNLFNIAGALVREIVYENDEGSWNEKETPEQRWTRMRKWVSEQIKE